MAVCYCRRAAAAAAAAVVAAVAVAAAAVAVAVAMVAATAGDPFCLIIYLIDIVVDLAVLPTSPARPQTKLT